MSVDELIEELNIIIHKVKMKMIFFFENQDTTGPFRPGLRPI